MTSLQHKRQVPFSRVGFRGAHLSKGAGSIQKVTGKSYKSGRGHRGGGGTPKVDLGEYKNTTPWFQRMKNSLQQVKQKAKNFARRVR